MNIHVYLHGIPQCINASNFNVGPDYTFSNLNGVTNVVVGYAGGQADFPNYKNIQDYTEALRITFTTDTLSYEDILHLFVEEQGGPPTHKGYSRQ
jgi:peptide methionine sulfoxide reductase MsrA